ncbi:MAG: DinB family protein [Pseudomonadota bacterium]
MSERAQFVLMASYNEWMNAKLYEAAARLPHEALTADCGAFFGSLFGTLSHLVAGDTIWLQRFARHFTQHAALDPVRALPPPAGLDAPFADSLPALFAHRCMLDGVIRDFVAGLDDADLEQVVHYTNTKGVVSDKRFASLLQHVLNHQTHHRGQASTLLSQAGIDIGVTDLLALIPNEALA